MQKLFKGRPVIPSEIRGEALVTRSGFNTLACFYHAILTRAGSAVCRDQGNSDLFGKEMTGKVICLPKSIGSTSAGAAWLKVAEMGIAPLAMLFSQRIDSLSAAGLILSEIWGGATICTVDGLGEDFLPAVRSGEFIRVQRDGTVEIDPY